MHTDDFTRQTLLQEGVTRRILRAFYSVYNGLGFGFMESVYARALTLEMLALGLTVAREVPVEVIYRGAIVGSFRVDLLVDSCVVVELKATRALASTDAQQLLNYLRGTRLEVGLLLHFGPKPAFKRLISSNDAPPRRDPRRSAGPPAAKRHSR